MEPDDTAARAWAPRPPSPAADAREIAVSSNLGGDDSDGQLSSSLGRDDSDGQLGSGRHDL